MKNIAVLMSTYNGLNYLTAQVESIIAQQTKNLSFFIRDDGSTDATVEYLSHLTNKFSWMRLEKGLNIGVCASFLSLLDSLPDTIDFVAFSDQDDIWDENKLRIAIENLEKFSPRQPTLYCSNYRVLSGSRLIEASPLKRSPSFYNALVQNSAIGCSIVLNRAAINVLKNRERDYSKILMHDRWCYLVISAFGEIIYDPAPRFNYRQHAANVIGSKTGLHKWLSRHKRSSKFLSEAVGYVDEFLRLYGEFLDESKRRVLLDFIERPRSQRFATRLSYAMSAPFFRQRRLDDFLTRASIAMGMGLIAVTSQSHQHE